MPDKLPLHSLNSLCLIIPVYSDLLLYIMPLGANLTFMGQISVWSTFEALTARLFGSSQLCVLCGIKGTEHRLSRTELLTRSGIIVDKTCDKSRLASDYFWHSRRAAARSAAFFGPPLGFPLPLLICLSLVLHWNPAPRPGTRSV